MNNDIFSIGQTDIMSIYRTIKATDLEGNSIDVVQVDAAIEKGTSSNYTLRVLNKTIYEKYRDTIQIEINKIITEINAVGNDFITPVLPQ